jgi:GT2 family glycosyltransferase
MSHAVDVLIVSYNSVEWLPICLGAVRDQEGIAARISVWDNASTDGSAGWLELAPLAQLQLSQENLGYGAALMRLLERTRAPWVWVVTPDMIPQRGAASRMIAQALSDESIGFVAGAVRSRDGRLESAGVGYTRSGLAYRRKRLDHTLDLFAPEGGFFLARRKALEEVAMDTSLFLYYEEIALGFRAQRAGWSTALAKEATAIHHGSHSSRSQPAVKARHLARSRWLAIANYWPTRWILGRAPILLAMELISLARAVGRRQLRAAVGGRVDALGAFANCQRQPFPANRALPWGSLREALRRDAGGEAGT